MLLYMIYFFYFQFIGKMKAKLGYLENTQQCTVFVPPDEEIAKTDPFFVQYHIGMLCLHD